MGLEGLQALEFTAVFWKARPFQRLADADLQSQFDDIPTEIRGAVESAGLQQRLRIGQAGTCDRLEVGCAQHDNSPIHMVFVRTNSRVVSAGRRTPTTDSRTTGPE